MYVNPSCRRISLHIAGVVMERERKETGRGGERWSEREAEKWKEADFIMESR